MIKAQAFIHGYHAKKVNDNIDYGIWIKTNTGFKFCLICSLCGWENGYPFSDDYHFCPNCGARMKYEDEIKEGNK